MGKRYKLILANRNIYKEIELPEQMEAIRIGTFLDCHVRIRKELFFEPFYIELNETETGIKIHCSDNIYMNDGGLKKEKVRDAQHGDELFLKYFDGDNEICRLKVLIDFEYESKDYFRQIKLPENGIVTIGNSDSYHIHIFDEYFTDGYIEMTCYPGGARLENRGSRYGFWVNGTEGGNVAEIKDTDFFSATSYSFYLNKGYLYASMYQNMKISDLVYEDLPDSKSEFVYPKFNRNPRLKEEANTHDIEILDPPENPSKPSGNIVMQLMPAFVMLIMTIVIRGFMSGSGNSTYIIFSVCSMSLGIVTSIVNIVGERKKYKKELKEREDVYISYIENKKADIANLREKEQKILENRYCNIEKEAEMIRDFSHRLYERTDEDDDFLEIRLGTGCRKSQQKIVYKEQEKLEIKDELALCPQRVAEQFAYIDNAPITVQISKCNAIGIIGTVEECQKIRKNIVLDMAARQYHNDVKFVFLLQEQEEVEWIKFLPNVKNDTLGIRNIINDEQSKNQVLEYLYGELTKRENQQIHMPYIVVWISNEWGIKKHPIANFFKKAKCLGVTFIFCERDVSLVHETCEKIVYLQNGSGKGTLVDVNNITMKEEFHYSVMDDSVAVELSRKLAPVYCEEVSLEGSLTKNISLFELLNIMSVDDIDLNRTWSESQIYKSMAAPLGVKAKDEVVYLDLNEKKHGPHGLVAGTTGSGKSEILQSYILSAALRFHPYEIGFVIIDFKGGGMVNQFRELPHLIGAITNIDGNEINRSLLSIKAELKKRQTLFAENGVNHIDAYIKKFKKGEASVPLPHLVLIVDEFAELKVDQPEFMKELISAARIGRSLGVHLILATQKPSGVVDAQIWSNSKFRLCLKVQNKEDSNEVLKTPLAAEIKEPGRAYLQVGNNEIFELFQSAYSGANAETAGDNSQKAFSICEVDYNGRRKIVYEKKKQVSGNAVQTQLEVVVAYIRQYCEEKHIDRLPGICLPPLEECIVYREGQIERKSQDIVVPIGICDDPNNQRQDKVYMNLSAGNTMIIGSSQYGKTNLLQTILRGIAENYTVQEVNVYIYDFASMALKIFDELHHVGGVVVASDDEKMKNSMRMFAAEIRTRKAKLSELGITSHASYREAGYSDMPQIIVMIDNFLAMRELYQEYEDTLLNIAREGIAVGISVIATALQSNGINYRFVSNFANKIALYCNQKDEYSTIFDRCRMQPKNVPGRGLVEIEKEVYEYQTYLAFEGEREIDRVNAVKAFVDKWNAQRNESRARRIPEVPKLVDARYVKENCSVDDQYIIPTGIDYDTVEWNCIDFFRTSAVGIIGKEHFGKTTVVRNILNRLQKAIFDYETKVYIIDDFQKQMEEFSSYGVVAEYSSNVSDFVVYLDEFEKELSRRKDKVQELGIKAIEEEPMLLMVIQNREVFSNDCAPKNVVEQYKKILKQYRQFKVAFLFADIPNMPAAVGAPEMLKAVKELEQFIICEDLANLKVIDIPAAVTKPYKKPLELGDAYVYRAGTLKKQKNIYEEAR